MSQLQFAVPVEKDPVLSSLSHKICVYNDAECVLKITAGEWGKGVSGIETLEMLFHMWLMVDKFEYFTVIHFTES